jgi:hypothetical protein
VGRGVASTPAPLIRDQGADVDDAPSTTVAGDDAQHELRATPEGAWQKFLLPEPQLGARSRRSPC